MNKMMTDEKSEGKKGGLWRRIKGWAYNIYRKIVYQEASPRSIAWGASVGVFLGLFPTFGLAIPVAVGLAFLFRFNKASAILGSAIMNPFTTPIFWALSAFIGGLLSGISYDEMVMKWHNRELFEMGKEFTLIYLLGNLVVSLVISVIIWVLIYFGARRIKRLKGGKYRK